ncbi:MAG: response regulator transcription factor [Anaerolineales bacterium]|nr:response regulator transcription factor [Anaerolineales bacterium]
MSNSIRVILIDDHPIVRSGIRLLLEQAAEIEIVGEAEQGKAGLQLVERLQPDVVLLDMEMPDMTGVEVMRTLQSENNPARVLGLSAYDDPEYIRNLLARGLRLPDQR